MYLGGVDRPPPRPPTAIPRGWHIRGFQPLASLGVRNPASQLLFITAIAPAASGVAAFGSTGDLLKGTKAPLITLQAGMRENEIGGRRVSGDCIKDRLSNSTCKLPYSLWKRGRSILTQQTQNRVVDPVVVDNFCRNHGAQAKGMLHGWTLEKWRPLQESNLRQPA